MSALAAIDADPKATMIPVVSASLFTLALYETYPTP